MNGTPEQIAFRAVTAITDISRAFVTAVEENEGLRERVALLEKANQDLRKERDENLRCGSQKKARTKKSEHG